MVRTPRGVVMMNIYEFGEQLLKTNDLDPVYVMLHEARLDRRLLRHWLLAYWGFYHVGTASWITEQPDYWTAFEQAAGSKDWPRCHERRHFRGANAAKSTAWLRKRGVDALFQPLIGIEAPLADVMKYVQTWVGFGPWIAFKVADMLERLSLAKIKFNNAAMFLFDSPRDGAALMWELDGGKETSAEVKQIWAVDRLTDHFKSVKAPPRYDRPVNAQEAETILCKFKSYQGGHYRIGEDIEATRRGLLRFAKCRLSQRLLAAGKISGLW
jgi:hypothetical protein